MLKHNLHDWFRRRPQRMPPDAYRPDRGHIETVRWLAFFLGLVTVFSVTPAVVHLNLATAPGWARVALALAALQVAYIVWMLVTPDWSTVWVVMLVFALVAALYALVTAIVLVTPLDRPVPLELGDIRATAVRWCGAVLMATTLATYLCGRAGARWRRRLSSAKFGEKGGWGRTK